MTTLKSLAIGVALVYRLASMVFNPGSGFFWELATLIDITLPGR